MMFNRLYPRFPPGYLLNSGFKLIASGVFIFIGAEIYTLNEKFYEKEVICLI